MTDAMPPLRGFECVTETAVGWTVEEGDSETSETAEEGSTGWEMVEGGFSPSKSCPTLLASFDCIILQKPSRNVCDHWEGRRSQDSLPVYQ